jgi:hypothetical protein
MKISLCNLQSAHPHSRTEYKDYQNILKSHTVYLNFSNKSYTSKILITVEKILTNSQIPKCVYDTVMVAGTSSTIQRLFNMLRNSKKIYEIQIQKTLNHSPG